MPLIGHNEVPDSPERVVFWTTDFHGKGTVHVHDRYVSAEEIGRVSMPFNPWMRARCGLLRREQEAPGLSHFDDGRLCQSCVKATPEAERSTLFEHPQDREDDDDG